VPGVATGLGTDQGSNQRASAWRRRNQGELRIRNSISADARLSIFASGFEPGDESPTVVVMITASEDGAKDAARRLLGNVVNADWDSGWRPLQLGDYLLRLYPDRPDEV
jgi:hypothetical protein